jgi:hypothetical protein
MSLPAAGYALFLQGQASSNDLPAAHSCTVFILVCGCCLLLLQVTALLQSKLAAQQAALAGRDQQLAKGTAGGAQQEVGTVHAASVPCKGRDG